MASSGSILVLGHREDEHVGKLVNTIENAARASQECYVGSVPTRGPVQLPFNHCALHSKVGGVPLWLIRVCYRSDSSSSIGDSDCLE
jgi:hypothetical protein